MFHIAIKYEAYASFSTQVVCVTSGSVTNLLHYNMNSRCWDLWNGTKSVLSEVCEISNQTLYHFDIFYKDNKYKYFVNGKLIFEVPFNKPSKILLNDDLASTKWLKKGWWQDCGVICDIDEKDLDLENRGDEIILPSYLKDYYTFPTYSANRTLYGIK